MYYSKKPFVLIMLFLVFALDAHADNSTDVFNIAATGTISDMEICLQSGIDINTRNDKGYTPLAYSILHDNYDVFAFLIERGADLGISTRNGCNCQILLGYFSIDNFKRACNLLNSKSINLDQPSKLNMSLLHYLVFSCSYEKVEFLLQFNPDLFRKDTISDSLPIDMLQYSNYEYTDIFRLSDEKKQNIDRIRKVLMDNGSPDITQAPLTIGRFGNFFFVHYKAINAILPDVGIGQVNQQKYYKFIKRGKQKTARIDLEKLYEMYRDVGLEVEINIYEDKFLDIMKQCEESPDIYLLIANMGNCPLISQYWVNLSGIEGDKYFLVKNDSDIRFELFDYRLQDVNMLITIRIVKRSEEKKAL